MEIDKLQDKLDSVKLIQSKSPKVLSIEEMNELVSETTQGSAESKNEQFKNHEIFDILDGHPQSIAISAGLLKEMRLLELYNLLKCIKENRVEINPI